MAYPDFAKLPEYEYLLTEYARLKCEQGAGDRVEPILAQVKEQLRAAVEQLRDLPDNPALALREPDELDAIRALRPEGPRRLWTALPEDSVLAEQLEGALYARIIGCLLGVPVEGWTLGRIEDFCRVTGKEFPPTDYWEEIEQSYYQNVYRRPRHEYRKSAMTEAPVDDDIIYTQLSLLLLEECGPDFTTADVGEIWKKYLPFACTAEDVALRNLKKGIPPEEAGSVDNPYRQWIGAAIRSDGFAYAAPGYPEKAAELAYRDAYLSHRRNGIYGEMFLAAAQSAAFAVSDPVEALRIGLTEIPQDCRLAEDLRWALEVGEILTDFREARWLVDERFRGMSPIHTNNNLCLVVFGLMLGRGDILTTLSETVAMGMDNDCTAASAGSIVGAIAGRRAVPEYLAEPLHDTCATYLLNTPKFRIGDMARRFAAIARLIHSR